MNVYLKFVVVFFSLSLTFLEAMTWEHKPQIFKSFKSTSENASVSDAGAYELCRDYIDLFSKAQWASACLKKTSFSAPYCKLGKSVSSFYGEITTWYKVDCR